MWRGLEFGLKRSQSSLFQARSRRITAIAIKGAYLRMTAVNRNPTLCPRNVIYANAIHAQAG